MPPGFPMPPGLSVPPLAPATPFERARKHKPAKKMRKLNWVKVPQTMATSPTALWHSEGDAGLKVNIDPVGVEVMFSQAVVVKKKPTEEVDGKKKSSVVSVRQPVAATLVESSVCVPPGDPARLQGQPECQHLLKAVQNVSK